MPTEPEETRLESIHVGAYKNLKAVDLDWSRTVVLLGPNGAGKTNLLECLALMFGTDRTLDLLRERAVPIEAGMLSCIVSGGPWLLPLAPAASRSLLGSGASSASPPFADMERRARTALSWWEHLGGTSSEAVPVHEALIGARLPQAVRDFLAQQAIRPTIRYELQAMPTAQLSERYFTCTLVADAVPPEVLSQAQELPQAFDPLRAWATGARSGPVDVLALPDAPSAPIRLEWLARQRRADEISVDLVRAMVAAEPHAQQLSALIADYLGDNFEAEGRWWLHEHGTTRARTELRRTLPRLDIGGIGAIEESWQFTVDGRDAGATDEDAWTESLSSGERRWADEALATAARSVDDLGRRCAWQAFFWQEGSANDADLLAEALDLVTRSEEDEYVTADVLSDAAKLFDVALTGAARSWLASGDEAAGEMLHALLPAIADLTRPPLTIRVLDEPEAHLHPAAQRQLAQGLSELTAESAVVIATHSPYLLGRTNWSYCSISHGRGENLPTKTIDASGEIAREIGLTRGEVLVSTRAILLVEGSHDQAFLDGVFGRDFRDAGVVIVPMRGTTGARALIDSEFWLAFTDTPFHVMFDGTRLDMVRDRKVASSRLTPEERQMRALLNAVRQKDRPVGAVGLQRPDIVTYIAEQVLPTTFPGWDVVLERWSREKRASRAGGGGGLKDWLVAQYGLQPLTTENVARYATEMATGGHLPPAELLGKIKKLLASPERVRG